MEKTIETIVEEYRGRKLNRRDLFTGLIAATGTYAAAQLFLEQSGLAATLVSEVESQQANVDSSTIDYPNGAIKLSGYLSKPKAKGKYPAIIVIHENRGLNDHTRDVARRFAAAGYVALAVDALSRKGGTAAMTTPEKVREAFAAIPIPDVMSDLNAGLTFLNKHQNVKKNKLASIGFCWGGARSFLLATEPNKLQAAVVFYGTAPTEEQLAKVHCPVLGIYGETDERITSKVPEVAASMKKLKKQYESKIYKDAAHAFFNDTNAERYNAEAAKDAWTQTLAFLKKNV
ncbi:MAG: dienelactone hydrolase family protein [Acidobacteriota bacterium]|jgi:carboxymethylenebutenolidase|nr:dienelactone hydrolase family protein [Acidobacteriota bacterium]